MRTREPSVTRRAVVKAEVHWEAGLPPPERTRKGDPMRKLLTAGWRRYAVAFVVAAASLGVIGACNPTKPPPPSTPCGAGVQACLTISPTEWTATSNGQTKTFTVKNLGPDQTEPLHAFLPSIGFLLHNDDCSFKKLVRGNICTVGALATDVDSARGKVGHIEVESGNSQVDPDIGQSGVSARLLVG